MHRWLTAALILAAISGAALSAMQQKKEWSFPDAKKNGRATVEYRRQGVEIVINYDYSQRNHKTKWLLIDLALSSRQRFVLRKDDIKLLTPDGGELPVAPQQALVDDGPGITSVLQNAKIFRRRLGEYFTQRSLASEPIRFQVAPPGSGVTSDEATVDDEHITTGALLFSAPDGRWPAGTYRLEITNDVAMAALPVMLE